MGKKKRLKKQQRHYIHKVISLGLLRVSFYKLRDKFTFRLEFSRGW